jgi:hypothetical protein
MGKKIGGIGSNLPVTIVTETDNKNVYITGNCVNIALFYKSTMYADEEKNMITKIMNKNITNNEKYKQISRLLFV